MTDERWRNFFQFAADAGLYPKDDWQAVAPSPMGRTGPPPQCGQAGEVTCPVPSQ